MRKVRSALWKASVILVPSYGMAWLTGEMVWVIPTLVAATVFAGAFDPTRRVDEVHDQIGKDQTDSGLSS